MLGCTLLAEVVSPQFFNLLLLISMRSSFGIILLILSVFCMSSLFANDVFEKDMAAYREVYLKAASGKPRAVRKAISGIRKLEKKYKNHPVILAYRGGALSLRGISASNNGLDRMRETEEGLIVIDRALRKLPKHQGHYLETVEAQLVAAFVFINIPNSMFHRLQEGNRLVEKLLAHQRFSEMPAGLQSAIYFAAATSAEKYIKPAEFKRYLELTVSADPDGKNGLEAKSLLQGMQD